MTETTKALKIRVGRAPFEQRLPHLQGDKSPCPVHTGGDGVPLTLWKGKDGDWLATCHSNCNKTWDAIGFVQAVDKVDFATAVERLGGTRPVHRPLIEEECSDESAPESPMTPAEWGNWGRELTELDAMRFAASRPDSRTPRLETMKELGCRAQGDYIGFPYRRGSKFYGVKMRHMDRKAFQWAHKPKGADPGLFNLDVLDELWVHDGELFVVESELDAAVLKEEGFAAVSVPNSAPKFSDETIQLLVENATWIFLTGDQDQPGVKCMDALQKRLPLAKAHRVRFDQAKDIGELAKQLGGGFATRLEALKTEALRSTWVAHNIPLVHTLTSEEPRWVIDRLLLYGGLTVLCGKQGAEKSLLGLLIAKAVSGAAQPPDAEHSVLSFDATGKRIPFVADQFLGREIPRPCPVLYIDRENPESEVTRRRRRIGLGWHSNFHYWGDWGDWTDPLKATPDDPEDLRLMEFAAKQKGLIIFDSCQDWLGDISVIDTAKVTQLMNRFKRLARVGAGVLLFLHDAKYGNKGWSGTSSFVAVPDMSIGVKKTEDGELQLREIRFRPCGSWEMDCKIHYTPHDDQEHTWRLELLRDAHIGAVIAKQIEERQRKAAAKEAEQEERAAKLDKLISADPTKSKADLQRETGYNCDTYDRLLDGKWGFDPKVKADGKVKWHRADGSPL